MQNELGSCRLSCFLHFRKKSGNKKEHRRHAPAHKIHLPAWTPNKEKGPEHHACAQNPPSEIPPKRYKNEFSTVIATTSAFRKLRTGVPPQRNPFFYPENGFCMHFYTVWRMSDFNGKTRYKVHFLSSRKNIKYTRLFFIFVWHLYFYYKVLK